jgi:hypothetical protein
VRGQRRQSGRPGARSGLGPGGPHGTETISVDRVDDPRSRGHGGHCTKEARLVTQHREVGKAITAVSQGERHIEQDTARIMASSRHTVEANASLRAPLRPVKSAISASNRVPA